jgi:hypothetical protein
MASWSPGIYVIYGNGGGMLPKATPLPVPMTERKRNPGFRRVRRSVNESDYLLFYAKGPVAWRYNAPRNMGTYPELYSVSAYYYLTPDRAGKAPEY